MEGFTSIPLTHAPLRAARRMVEEASAWKAGAVKERLQGERAGAWHSGELRETYTEREWDVTPFLDRAGTYSVLFRYTGGAHRLDIAGVVLLEDERIVARDEHPGTTGIRNEGNRYRLVLATWKKDARYTLRARIKTAGGTDSNGEVRVARLRTSQK